MSHRDGHALNLVLRSQEITAIIVCPHAGKDYEDLREMPQCRLQQENGDPGIGPYLVETCAVAENFAQHYGTECIYLPEGQTFDVTTLPVPVEWHLERPTHLRDRDPSELWVTPIAPEATP